MMAYDTPGLWAIYGFSHNDVFAVGDYTILHYDGVLWSPMECPSASDSLRGVWGASPTDVHAVGGGSGGVTLWYGYL